MGPERRTAWVVLVAGGVVLLAGAALLVPWHPVPGGAVTPVPADQVVPAEQVARAQSFALWSRTWSYGSLAVSLLVALWWALSRRGRAVVGRLPGPWWVVVVEAVALLSVVGRVVTLPFAAALHQHLVDGGLSTQSWASYAADVAKREALDVVVTSIGVLALVACARRWRRAWPAVAGGLLATLVVLGSFVYPVLVEPVFNSFTPLPDGPLRTQVLDLADREGVPLDDVLVSDASRRTTTLNAYVSGFGGTRRVVLYDNLVEDLPRDEALTVVAHELAHARHDDVVTGTLLGAAGALAGVGLLAVLVGALRRRGHPGVADARAVPLVLVLVALGTVLSAPLQNAVSRAIETRADVDALRATDDPTAFVAVQRRFVETSLADPDPPALVQWWWGTHPTASQRVAVAQRYADQEDWRARVDRGPS